ncbi:MAG TPA: AAA family ATPase, partial [Candidatus Dormibacteraeota bacterium]|nr:AAA family ATPase [Candidatus Dormibacteraeota bacterium]
MIATPRFHGRVEELAFLSTRLHDAATGGGGLLIVEGGPGLGKTRLLAEVAALARSSGFAVASCAVEEGEASTPARALAPLAGGEVVLLGPDDLAGLAARPDRRFLLLDRLRANLAERTRRDPLLVILDDAQWADPATLLVLRTLTPSHGPVRCLRVVARRPVPVSPELRRALAGLHAGGSRLRLAPLASSTVAALVQDAVGALPDQPLGALLAGAAGNPRYVVELLAGLVEEGAVDVREGRARLVRQALPARLRDAVHADLGALSADARSFLADAAIFGRTFSVRDVATMLGCPGGRLLPAAEEALRAGFLVDAPPRLAFRHALVSDVLYEGLGEERRRLLPREAAGALGAFQPPGETARQFAARARPGDRRAIALLERAADDVARRSPSAAADVLLRVLELLPASDPERSATGARACVMLAHAGRVTELTRLAAALLDGAPEPVAHVRHVQALVLAGEYDRAIVVAGEAIAAGAMPRSLRAQLLSASATARALNAAPDVGAAEAEAAAAIAEGEATGQDAVAVDGLCAVGWIELRRGRLAPAHAAVLDAVRRSDAGSVDARRRHPRLLLALVLAALDRLDEAERALFAVRQEVAEHGSEWALPHARALDAALLLARGRLPAAVEEATA